MRDTRRGKKKEERERERKETRSTSKARERERQREGDWVVSRPTSLTGYRRVSRRKWRRRTSCRWQRGPLSRIIAKGNQLFAGREQRPRGFILFSFKWAKLNALKELFGSPLEECTRGGIRVSSRSIFFFFFCDSIGHGLFSWSPTRFYGIQW